SNPVFEKNEEYLSINIKESTSNLMEAGKPIIPTFSKIFTFPIGTKISNVNVNFDVKEYVLPGKIQPSPSPVPLTNNLQDETIHNIIPDKEIYSGFDLYPSEPYYVRYGAGLKDREHVIYLTVVCYVQYSPAANVIKVPKNIDIEIEYMSSDSPFTAQGEYDMLIITDDAFVSELKPLVDHKNDHNVKTIIETVQTIYSAYDGRDNAEDIKLRIKDAVEEWGVHYVLLAGGRKGQTFDWYIPERKTNNGDDFESGYASDLYYADLYKIVDSELVFDDWDSNGNGIFAEFSNFVTNRDKIDYIPDVTVGRLPFRYKSEIKTVVDKIINYENNADDSWFKKAVVIGGDGGPPARGYAPGIYEDELECDLVADMLENNGFNVEKLYTSLGTFASKNDVITAISNGAGLIHMSGHGNPAYWGNFLPDAETEEGMVDGLQLKDMNKLTNKEKLPIITVGGCHNAQFNVTMMNIPKDILEYGIKGYLFERPFRFYYMEWVPRCFCTWLVFKNNGGAIASIGNTGLGIGYVNEHWNAGLSGWIMPRFYDCYTNQSKNILGEAHDQAITDYINIIGGENSHHEDRKTIEEWILIGDPSLKIGGY
ncbi:MAG: peptidase C25, partial [Thermoplasmata archaeon M8B2D]